MELAFQIGVVAVAVLASTLFATWRLTPARTRYRLLNALPASPDRPLGRWVNRLKNKAATELTHGCSTCSASPTQTRKHAPLPKR